MTTVNIQIFKNLIAFEVPVMKHAGSCVARVAVSSGQVVPVSTGLMMISRVYDCWLSQLMTELSPTGTQSLTTQSRAGDTH